MKFPYPSINDVLIARKALIYLAVLISTLHRRKDSYLWKEYWKLYNNMISNSFLGKLKGIVSLPNGYRAVIRLFNHSDFTIFPEIFEEEVYERYCRPRKGDIVIDVGAYIGFFTMKMARLVKPSGQVISIEPDPENYKLLVRNIKLNHLTNVVPLRMALVDKEGFSKLFFNEEYLSGHSIMFRVGKRFVKVPTMTLDKLIKKLNLTRVDFIKIDAEGAEYAILKGGENTLKVNDVRLAIEAAHDETIKRKCIAFLKNLGYKVVEEYPYLYSWKS